MSGPVDKDLYSVLGADPLDSQQQLKHKYQKLALLYHPDRLGPEVCAEEAESSLQKFLEMDAAWRILSDQTARKQYDTKRRAQDLKQDWPVEATIYLGDMVWNEDDGVYTYDCRCGGQFSISKEELEEGEEEKEEGQRKPKGEEDQEEGAILCCDTCSLSIEVRALR